MSQIVHDSIGRQWTELPTTFREVWEMPPRRRPIRFASIVFRALATVGFFALLITVYAMVSR